jgi:hypothetical protein
MHHSYFMWKRVFLGKFLSKNSETETINNNTIRSDGPQHKAVGEQKEQHGLVKKKLKCDTKEERVWEAGTKDERRRTPSNC